MKKIFFIVLFVFGCSTTLTEPVKIGTNSYTLSVGHSGIGSGLTSHAELREQGIKKATAFCQSKNLEFQLTSSESNGLSGFTSLDDIINFTCT